MEFAYFVAIILICLNVFLIFVDGILKFLSSCFIEGMCVVALASSYNVANERLVFGGFPSTCFVYK